ncbi:hypothetical protein [Nocardioides immobilis]|uniref:hypothetical protein n=1 Tax=Nocardioides immobilis TaxID=2049295 RepID=UPI0011C36B7F|nr:hypothetical protein [Nocardioides immobilis]
MLFDPARGTAALRAATEDAATRSGLPTSIEDGAEEGLVQLHVWVGGLGLGLPDDRPEAWAELGLALGAVVVTVDPALALAAPEWGAGSLADPDPDELAPGLRSGRARRRRADTARAERFTHLADREVVRADDDGWVWAATGAVPLWAAPPVEADRLVPAVFHAWWGRRPDQAAPVGPRLRLASRDPDPDLATALAAALPAGWSSEPTAPDAAVATPPEWADPASLREVLAEVALLIEPRWALLRDPDVLWLSAAPDQTGGLQITPLAGYGVLVEGPYPRLERLLDVPPPGRI